MAQIKSWSGDSPHAREVLALDRMRTELPSSWFGYANVFVKDPKKDAGLEVDLILVCDDRILMIDVKDWAGTVIQGRGDWLQKVPGRPPKQMGGDPVLKLFRANNALRSRMEAAGISPLPYVQSAILFVSGRTNITDVAKHAEIGGKGRVVSLDAFLSAASNSHRLDQLLGQPGRKTRPRSLTDKDGKLYQPLRNFFTVGRDFSVLEINYGGYRAKNSSISDARLWRQFEASSDEAHGDVGLLRLWDFDREDGLSIEDTDRETLVGREAIVQGFLRTHKTGREVPILDFKQSFNDGGARRWELFQNSPDNISLRNFLSRGGEDISSDARKDLLQSLMAAGAAMSSVMVAHRDLGEHSVWIDLERRTVSISNFVSARVPETTTAGRHLVLLARGGPADPSLENSSGSVMLDPFCSDVHAFAYVGLKILLGRLAQEELDDSFAVYDISDEAKLKADIGPGLGLWFEKALDPEQSTRFSSCADAHTALVAAIKQDQKTQPADELLPYQRKMPCFADHPQNETIESARPGVMEWRSETKGGIVTRARLWVVPASNQRQAKLDFVRRGAALSVLPPLIAPRIVECSIDASGPFLCVEEIAGKRLSEADVDLGELGDDEIIALSRKIVSAVLTAHEFALAHGDLSPSNVIYTRADTDNVEHGRKEVDVRLIDWLDFSSVQAGPRENILYGGDETDPFLRDRRALGKIVLDVVKVSRASAEIVAAAEAFADENPIDDMPHWREISQLDCAMLLAPPKQHNPEKIYVRLDRLTQGQLLPPQDGGYLVLFDDRSNGHKHDRPRATIVGLGTAAVIEFDRRTGLPCQAYSKASTMALEIAAGRHGERIELQLYADASAGLESWNFLTALSQFGRLTFDRSEAQESAFMNSTFAVTESNADNENYETKLDDEPAYRTNQKFPSPLKLWEVALLAEEANWPSATALSLPQKITAKSGHYKIDVEFAVDPSRLEDGTLIYVGERRKGKFDKLASSEDSLVIENDREPPWIKAGDRLEFRSKGEMSNIRRRSAAVARIGMAPQIENLPVFFSENARAELGETFTIQLEQAEYGLNSPQAEALDKLWCRGPVSFLQGPPGTGKTKFIAAFVHHALTVGGARNVLLTAQTHEAVDGAALRVVELFKSRNEDIDLIRIASNAEKVDISLKDAHAHALQGRVREKFIAERAERIVALGTPLGLEADFVRECAKLLKGVVATAESVAALKSENNQTEKRFLVQLTDALQQQCEAFGLPFELADEPHLLRRRAIEDAVARYGVRRGDAVDILLKLFDAASEYEEALGQRGALEPVFVRTRRLVCGTCVGLGDEKLGLGEQAFDLVVVDEAARAQGSELAIPLSTARKVLLVGDQKQLEPFWDLKATRHAAEILGIDETELAKSDFARGFDSPYGRTASARLDIQYRMAPRIGKVVSDVFYAGELSTGRGAPTAEWANLPWPFDQEISWVDVDSEEKSKDGRIRNEAEVEDIMESLELLSASEPGERLLEAHEGSGSSEPFIGVIAMYADQAVAIRHRIANSSLNRRWRDQIKIGTVDSYQGKENSIILVSMVRDNPKQNIGFLRKENRINVALSRAKERLVVFGSQRMFRNAESKLSDVLSHPEFDGRVAALRSSPKSTGQ